MTEDYDSDKAAKKAAKAQAKRAKKEAKAAAAPGPDRGGSGSRLSAAERSAAAAERQVRLQRWRVVFALLMVLVAVATFLATYRPWADSPPPKDAAPLNPATSPGQ